MRHYEIHIYGLHSTDVTLKKEYEKEYGEGAEGVEALFFDKFFPDWNLELDYVGTGDYDNGNYIGLRAFPLYPWDKDELERPRCPLQTGEEVQQAIVEAVSQYVKETPDEIRAAIRLHDDVGHEE